MEPPIHILGTAFRRQETDRRDSITEADAEHYKAELAKQARAHVLNDIPERPVEPSDMIGSNPTEAADASITSNGTTENKT